MKSLYEWFSGLSKSYYGIPISADRLFVAVNATYNCDEFINEHFERGKKKSVLTIPDSYIEEYRHAGKHQHTVALYLLGLLLKSNISNQLKHKMGKLFNVNSWYSYEYTWYLTCLYHDVTSVVEGKLNHKAIEDGIEKAKNSKLFKQSKDLMRFSPSIYIEYARYRKSASSLEHGIIGGTALFDSLCDSFENHTQGHKWEESPVYCKDGVIWRKEHIQHFAYIADAICCHNIWLAPSTNQDLCEKYHAFNLGSLIVHSDEDKLSFEDYPLQFILCLLDTIEPVKRFRCVAVKDILDNIFLEVESNKITIGWSSRIRQHDNFEDWIVPINRISDWMKIKVSPCYHEDTNCYMTLSWEN